LRKNVPVAGSDKDRTSKRLGTTLSQIES